jgi:DNA-binding transcriptional ArsR family regulator
MSPSSSELINAIGHPLRRRILRAYLEDSRGGASARELAEALGQRVGQVDYHLKTMARSEILRPVRRNGGDATDGQQVWALDIDAVWMELMLEVWGQADDPVGR